GDQHLPAVGVEEWSSRRDGGAVARVSSGWLWSERGKHRVHQQPGSGDVWFSGRGSDGGGVGAKTSPQNLLIRFLQFKSRAGAGDAAYRMSSLVRSVRGGASPAFVVSG